MDWVNQIMIYGVVAFIFFSISVFALWRKWYTLGLVFGIFELLSAAVSSKAWAWALKASGKVDWFLLGILGYPLFGLIFWSMFIVGVLCIRSSILGIHGKRNGFNNPNAEESR